MSNKAKIREVAKKLVPIDDIMFRKMAEDDGFCQEILRVILNDSKLIVVRNQPQFPVTNLQGRSVILDAHCILGDGREVDIEVQKANDDNHQKRVRYNEKFPLTSAGKHRYRETEEGQQIMCEIIEKLNSEAREEGINVVNALNLRLLSENRIDDLRRAATDTAYQTQLINELFPEKTQQQ